MADPVAPPTNSVTTNEDTASSAVPIGATDADNDILTYSVDASGQPTKGNVSFDQVNGTFTYTPAANANGSDSFIIDVDDGHGGIAQQTVSVTINAVNDAPTASPTTSLTTDEDTQIAASVGATDVDGDTLTYSVDAAGQPTKGSVSFDQVHGSYTYIPSANQNGSDSFVIDIDDGHGGVTQQTVSVTINPVNDAPAASPTNSVTTDEDTTSSAVAIGATDVDGDTLTYSVDASGQPAKGSVSFDQANGTFTYTPTANENGSDSFIIDIDDGHGGIKQQTVSVTINPVNDAPTASPTSSLTTDEDTQIAASVGATDVDGDTLTYSVDASGQPTKGSVSFDQPSGSFTYTPSANQNGSDSFIIDIDDGHGGTTQQTVSVTINPVNDAPAASPTNSVTTDEDTASSAAPIGATDVDGDTLTYSVDASGQPTKGSVSFDQPNGTFTYTPAANENGSDSFVIDIDDGNGGVTQQTVSVTINPVNDAPAAAPTNSVTTDEDTASSAIAISATDVEGDTLTYSVDASGQPTKGAVSFDQVNGTFTYTPAANQNGSDSFIIDIDDGNGGVTQQTVSVTINPVNDAPAAAPTNNVTTDEDTASSAIAIGATDVEGDTLTYSVDASGQPTKGSVSFDQVNGTFTYTPTANENGSDSFVIDIDDGNGGVTQQTVSVTINPVNDAPAAAPTNSVTTDEDTASSAIAIGATDVEGDTLTYSVDASGQPTKGAVSFDQVNGTFTYTPAANQNGSDSFIIDIDDGNGGVTQQTVSVTINPVNDAPTSSNLDGDTVSYTENASPVALDLGGDASVSDIDSADFNGGSLRVSITGNLQAGEDVLGISAGGGITLSNGTNVGSVVSVGGNAVGTVSSNGTGGNDLVIDLDTANATPAAISSLIHALNYKDTSDNPDTGQRDMTITVTDGDGGTDTMTAVTHVTISAVDDAPTAVDDPTNQTNENATLAIAVLANDTDPDGGPKGVTQVNGTAISVGSPVTLPSGAIVSLNNDGTLTYDPNHKFDTLTSTASGETGAVNTSAPDSFTYTLNGGSTATVSVTVNGVVSSQDQLKGDAGDNTITGTPSGDFFDLSQGGNDTVSGLGANDGFFFGAAFTAADHVDGGGGTNDQIGLQGNYTGPNALVLGANTITNIEALVLLPGFSYDITTNDGNVAAGGLLKVQATQLAPGQNLHFDGSAEHDGSFLVFGGNGNDTMIGGDQSDGFYFGPGQFTAADVVNGGAGSNDQLGLDGNYGAFGPAFVLGGNITNVEVVVLLPGPSGSPNTFNLTTSDALVPSGQTLTIFGVQVTTNIAFDGSHEHDGAFKFYGGSGDDSFTGSTGGDWIFGGGGSDALQGGAGSDTYYYDDASQSTSTTYDKIFGFDDSSDTIDLPFAVTGFATPASGNLSTASFDSDLSAAFSGLTSHQAGMFTATGGDLNGHSFLVIDADGNPGYQAGSDYVIEIVSPVTPIDNPAIFV